MSSQAPGEDPAIRPIHHEVLPNGLTLLLYEAHLAPVANLQIWAKVGAADERPGEEGLAHFHEHMLFKGTARRGVGEIAGEVEGAGGRINAYTSFDVTVYHATMPSESLGIGLDVLADALCNSSFDAKEIEREREVVLEEIRRANDSPAHVLGDAIFDLSYQVHPYRSPILGPAENVASFDRARVTRFFERWYTPDNLVVVAAGDFDSASLARQIDQAFGDAPARGTTRARANEPAQTRLRTNVLCRPFEGVRADLAWRAVRFADADAPLLDLLSFILGECESSRLVQGVRDAEQLVDRIDSSSYAPIDPGLFSVDFETTPGQVEQAIEAVAAEVERLRCQPVTDEELERARTNFLASEHFERESVSGLAGRLGSFHVLGGDYRKAPAYLAQIRSAAPADLLRAARAHLAPEHLNVAALLPESDAEALDDARIGRAVGRGIERTKRRFSAPARLSAASGDSGLHSFRLPSGASLHVRPRRDVPVVAARVAMLGGQLVEDEASAGITSFLSSMWTRGTRARSAVAFARAVEAIAADINGFSGRNSQGFAIDVTSDKLEPALDLFAEALLEPAFDTEEVERERRETLASIDRRADRLAQLAYIQFGELHFPKHPYRLPIVGHESSVKRIDADSLRAHHDRLVRGDNLVIGVAGDVDPEAVAECFAVRLGELPEPGFEPTFPDPDEPCAEIQVGTLKKDRAQAHLVLGFRGLTVADPDRAVLDVLSQVLAGQSGRLFLELRDKRSLAYSVSAISVEGVAPGFFSVYIATANDKVDEARQGILDELAKLIDRAPSDSELSRARRYVSGNLAIDAQRNSNHAAHIALDALYGLGPDAHDRYAEQISAVSPQDVLRVARRILTLDAYTLSIVGDV
jgi:zinc protease